MPRMPTSRTSGDPGRSRPARHRATSTPNPSSPRNTLPTHATTVRPVGWIESATVAVPAAGPRGLTLPSLVGFDVAGGEFDVVGGEFDVAGGEIDLVGREIEEP